MKNKYANEGEIIANGNLIKWNKEKLYFSVRNCEDDNQIIYNEVINDREKLETLLSHYRISFIGVVLTYLSNQPKAELVKKEVYKIQKNPKTLANIWDFYQLLLKLNSKDKEKILFQESYYLNMDITHCYKILCWMLDEECLI